MQPKRIPPEWEKRLLVALAVIAAVVAVYSRSVGIFRGLPVDYGFHPDEPKQMEALRNYLSWSYIWYHDHPQNDGYPLFKTHLDEWIIRGLSTAGCWVTNHLIPSSEVAASSGFHEWYWARGLSAFYGMVMVALTFAVARRIGLSRAWSLAATLLMALSPMSVAVAHFGAGDIGTDLFSLLTVLFLGLHCRKPEWKWMLLSGVMTGFAFASKYNGILIGMVTGMYLLAVAVTIPRAWRRLPLDVLACGAGFFGGVVAAMPQFVFATAKTWTDFLAIMRYVQNYAVPVEIQQLPFLTKAWLGFKLNLPYLLPHFGWIVLVLAFAGCVAAALKLRSLRSAKSEPAAVRAGLLGAAVCLFPFLVIAVSLASKYKIKPFHFSFIQFAMCIGAAYLASVLWADRRGALRFAAPALMVIAVAGEAFRLRNEVFFWGREDLLYVGCVVRDDVFRPGNKCSFRKRSIPTDATIKQLYLEPENPASFRNRPANVFCDEQGAFWNRIRSAPVPCVPLSVANYWIFNNGPVFPRNDRLFRVPHDTALDRMVVLYARPETMQLGVRSGSFPAKVRIRYGGADQIVTLGANDQALVEVRPQHWKTVAHGYRAGKDVYLVPLTVRTRSGPVWVQVMGEPRDAELFRLFGGQGEKPAFNAAEWNEEEVVAALSRVRFLENDPNVDIDRPGRPAPLFGGYVPLPAGAYIAEAELFVRSEGAKVALRLSDAQGLSGSPGVQRAFAFERGGVYKLRFEFLKTFAPLECSLDAVVIEGSCRVGRVSLTPDVRRILGDLGEWEGGKGRPAWASRFPRVYAVPREGNLSGARLGRYFELDTVSLPETIVPGGEFNAFVRLWPIGVSRKMVEECHVFIHLRDSREQQVAAFDVPAWRAAFGKDPMFPLSFRCPEDIAPGEYAVYAGMWNVRTRLRLPLAAGGSPDDAVPAGHVVVAPAATAQPSSAAALK